MAIEKVKATLNKDAAPVKATATVKVDALKTDVKTEVKPEVKAEVKKPVAKKAAAKKPAAKKTAAAKKTTAKKATATKAAAAKTATAKKPAAKKPAAKKTVAAKKVDIKTKVVLQFGDDQSYTEADLVKIAKDVWKYDLGKKVADFKSVDLYVKPFEHKAYYVINGDVAGDFNI
ncbi:MAG: DUF6465 family protein [Lachnospiraceae bacterium]|nr:DUF6465 family protein [Lachnospiraceae bacterium]